MSGFAADWLDLREAADAKARSRKLLRHLGTCSAFTAFEASAHGPRARRWRAVEATRGTGRVRPAGNTALDIFDLGGGTGANLRVLAPVIGGGQRWRIVDRDPALLAAQSDRIAVWARTNGYGYAAEPGTADANGKTKAPARMRVEGEGFAATVDTCRLDLSGGLAALGPCSDALVTASALLDLVSDDWLRSMIDVIASGKATGYFALTYDGRIEILPADPLDASVRDLVNTHQQRDKGFGPALGPRAAHGAVRYFEDAGYVVETDASDWMLGAGDRPLQHALVDGWIDAAREVDPGSPAALEHWRSSRHLQIANGDVRIRVGHQDLLAMPMGPSDR